MDLNVSVPKINFSAYSKNLSLNLIFKSTEPEELIEVMKTITEYFV